MSPGAYQSPNEHISNPAQVAKLLINMRESRTLLSVNVPGSETRYTSLIIDVDANEKIAYLDELHPEAGHKRLLDAGVMHVHARLNGVELGFSAQLLGVVQKDGAACYKVEINGAITHMQHRAHFRVPVGFARPIPVTLTLAETLEIKGNISDLSIGGASATFSRRDENDARVTEGELIYCRIYLPASDVVVTEFEPRFSRYNRINRMLSVGGRFVNFEGEQRRKIERFVVSLERDLLQKRRR